MPHDDIPNMFGRGIDSDYDPPPWGSYNQDMSLGDSFDPPHINSSMLFTF